MEFSRFAGLRYAPIIEVRPAEMMALETLPEKDKDLISPILKLRPWTVSLELANSIDRIKDAFGTRRCFLALAELDFHEETRPVHKELRRLADPTDGFVAWCKYFEQPGNEHFIPCAQITHPSEFDLQVKRLAALGRGLAVVIESDALPYTEIIAQRLAAAVVSADLLFLLDHGRQGSAMESGAEYIRQRLQGLSGIIPGAALSVSASSFPEGFVGLDSQSIFERLAFDKIEKALPFPLVYSDRGSARAERQLGGGGAPAPRIDYPLDRRWYFFRSTDDTKSRLVQYQNMARAVMASKYWDPDLRVWGTQMIERTALGEANAITSPPRATAVRINIHLHRQLHYGNLIGLYDTEDPWEDES